MIRTLFLAALLLTLVTGCKNSDENSSVTRIEDSDVEMAAAIETAKKTFAFFEENWDSMENDGYSVKFALPTSDGELEHIWFAPTSINSDLIVATCANDPVKIPRLKMGDRRTLRREDVSDWMIVVGNQCYGGYTIRVLAERDPDVAPPFEFLDPPTQ